MKKRLLFLISILLWSGILCFVTLNTNSPLETENLVIHFIDVGYGDAILIELPSNENILLDSGTKDSAEFVLNYLSRRNIKGLKAVILTHPHDNHFGGFLKILENIEIQKFYYNGDERAPEEGYTPLMDKIAQMKIPTRKLQSGNRLKLSENVEMMILHPQDLKESTNSRSLVSWLTFKNTSFLFTADIKKKQQKELIERYPHIRDTDGIQVPHHGGKIAKRFGHYFGEKIFIVSTGRNEHNKPYPDELAKISGQIFRTDILGSIQIESNGEQIKVTHEK